MESFKRSKMYKWSDLEPWGHKYSSLSIVAAGSLKNENIAKAKEALQKR